jgi:hypothetical protein
VSGLQQEEALRACGRLEEGPPLLDGDDVVPHAVADEDGAVQRPYTPEARVGVGHQRCRDERVVGPRHRAHARER